MEKQEIFDKVYDALLKQGVASIDSNGSCMYRGPNGTKCAIGHLIPDELFEHDFNYADICDLPKNVFEYFEVESDEDFIFLRNLQIAHDIHLALTIESFTEKMREIASKYNLEFKF